MKPTIRTVAQERKPLEDRRAELLAELEEINNLLGAIGRPSASNAAIRYIETNPGAKTSNIIAATGICPIQLSRMKRWGRLHNSGNPGRRGGDTQWWVVEGSMVRSVAAIVRPSAANAAIRYIEVNPGAKTSDIVAATGVYPTQLSRMKRWGRLRNSGNPGRRGGDTQWWMVIESTNERPRKKCEAPRMTESIMDRWPDDAKEKTP